MRSSRSAIKTETTAPPARPKTAKTKKRRIALKLPANWKRRALVWIGIPFVLFSCVMAYYWVVFSHMIDVRQSHI